MATVLDRFYGTGRRKTSVARVWIRPGSGRVIVNRRAFEDYFPRETLRMIIAQPLPGHEHRGAVRPALHGRRRRAHGPGRRRAPRARPRARPLRREAALAAQEGRPPHPRPAHARAQEVRPAGRAAEVPVLQALSDVATSDRIRVAVAGASGYMGAELLRLLLTHPRVTLTGVTSERLAGERARRSRTRTCAG